MKASFLTGPVALRPEVRASFAAPPLSHREPAFIALLARTRTSLLSLVNASNVALMVGSGTLANDAVAAQLASMPGPGLILSNGEFGERLIDHAQRWNLEFRTEQLSWGSPFDWERLNRMAAPRRSRWIWAVLSETSTGMANPLPELLALAHRADADLCLDAVSAIGLAAVDLRGVRFATAVSGKGLASYPGLAAVFHDGRLATPARIPRYLDLSAYDGSGVPYTHSSNLVAALERSLTLTQWPAKFESVREKTRNLRNALRQHGLAPWVDDDHAAPGVITLALPLGIDAANVALALADQGIDVAWQSQYLRERNWLQIALMGEIDDVALLELPAAIAGHVARTRANSTASRNAARGRDPDATNGPRPAADLHCSSSRTRSSSQSSFGRPLQR